MFTLEKKFRFRPHAMIQYGTLNASFIEGIKSLCQHNLSLFVFLGRMHVHGDWGLNEGLVDIPDKEDVDAMFERERG